VIGPDGAHRKPLPAPDADTAAFWQGIARGELLLQHCLDCGHVQYYQQAICRSCRGGRLEHRAASGRGTLYAFSVVHRAPGPAFRADVPYAVLLVELTEGPRMISSLIGAPHDAIEVGMRMELVCERVDEGAVLPRFRPVR
jgi:uncharacterized OB-fold protein